MASTPRIPGRLGETPALTSMNGVPGFWLYGQFHPTIGGGEDDPPKEDPKGSDDPPVGKDGKPFDPDRAQATIDALRAEIRGFKGTKAELDAAKARLQEIEDANKSETEKATTKATEAEQKLIAVQADLAAERLGRIVERTAVKLGFHDPDDAFALLDRKAVVLDDAGLPTNVETLLTALAKVKPHLVKADGEQKPPAAQKGTPPTPKPNGKPSGMSDEQQQRAREQTQGVYTGTF